MSRVRENWKFAWNRREHVYRESFRPYRHFPRPTLRSVLKMAARPTVNVRGIDGAASGSLPLPAVFNAPIRPDVVQAIHCK